MQYSYDTWRIYTKKPLQATYNELIAPHALNPELTKNISFGFQNLVANWYWLQVIQYYGGGDPYGEYKKLPKLLDNVVTLNPKFEYAYTFTLLVVPGEGMGEEAFAIGRKGMEALPDSWQIPYYMGTAYHINEKDYANAAKYLELAASKPGAPEIAKLLAAVYYSKSDQREIAYNLYRVIYETSEDDYSKERAKHRLENIEIMLFLEEAANVYKDRFGEYPSDLNLLVQRRIIAQIPTSPLEREFWIDQQTGTVSDENRE